MQMVLLTDRGQYLHIRRDQSPYAVYSGDRFPRNLNMTFICTDVPHVDFGRITEVGNENPMENEARESDSSRVAASTNCQKRAVEGLPVHSLLPMGEKDSFNETWMSAILPLLFQSSRRL